MQRPALDLIRSFLLLIIKIVQVNCQLAQAELGQGHPKLDQDQREPGYDESGLRTPTPHATIMHQNIMSDWVNCS